MSVKIYFDLDGTLFDLYGKKDWLTYLEDEIPGAFKGDFLPSIDVNRLYDIMKSLAINGVQFEVITWLPRGASPEYSEICKIEKIEWVKQYVPFVTDIHCIPYGTPKQYAIQKRAKSNILIDDNYEICKMWETAKQRKAFLVTEKKNVVDLLEDIYFHI